MAKLYWRRLIFWLLIIGFIWLVVSRMTEIEELIKTLSSGEWQWVLIAALLQVIYYTFFTAIYQSAFDTVELKTRIIELLPLTFAALFISVAAPSGGASSVALFVDDATHRGRSRTRTALGTLLVVIANFSAFLPVLFTGLVYLFRQHDLQLYEILGALVLLAIIGGLSGLLLLGLWRPAWLYNLLAALQKLTNGLAKKYKPALALREDWAKDTADEFSETSMAIVTHPERLWRTIAIALGAHLVNITSLYFIFLAFHQPVGIGLLVAGYSIGLLFWTVSITPQGIGVVEGVMTLVFTSLDVPTENAAIIALSFRGLTFWLPFGIGFLMLRRIRSFGYTKHGGLSLTVAQFAAILTALMGLVNILSALSPSETGRLQILRQYSPLGVSNTGHLAIALAGFALLLLSTYLWRRKRVAWLMAESFLIFSASTHITKGLDYEEALLALCLAAWLVYLRPHFHARSDRPTTQQGILALIAAISFTLFYGIVGFYLLDQHFQSNYNLSSAVQQTIAMFTQFQDPGLAPTNAFGRYFGNSIYLMGATTFTYAMWMLIRPALARQPASAGNRIRAFEIVNTWERFPLARLVLLEDKFYFFSSGGSLVAYVNKVRIALVLGDPIGPPEDFLNCIAEFKAMCASHEWLPAFYLASPDHIECYQEIGYHTLCIGQEGRLDLNKYSPEEDEYKFIFRILDRMNSLGFRAEIAHPPHSPELLFELHQISDEWLTIMQESEKRFSQGWFDEEYVKSGPLLLIHNSEGRIDAFANIILQNRIGQATLDLIRHRQEADEEQNDFLLASFIRWAHGEKLNTCGLGLSALPEFTVNHQDAAIEQALHYIHEHIFELHSYKGTQKFKDRRLLVWSPRYLVYPGMAYLPAVTIALIRADSGDDLLGGYLRHTR